jgi:hypothetical protein
MSEIDLKEFGALQAKMEVMTDEMYKLRDSMQKIQTTLDKGSGGLMVLMFAAGSFGSILVLTLKKVLGIA